jgi:raffinose/stachyose/melibiose transport system permease protein
VGQRLTLISTHLSDCTHRDATMTATIGTGPVVREGTATAGGGTPSRPRRDRPLINYGHWWWALPAIVMVLLIHYIATAGGAFYAFTNWTGIGDFDFVGLDNFKRIFEDPALIGSLKNTLFLAFGFLILTNVLGLLLALALNRSLKTRYLLRVLLFMPVVLSPLAVSYIWKFIFDFKGPLNSFLGWFGMEPKVWLADPTLSLWAVLVVMTWQTTGMCMVIYLAGLATVSQDIEEAAALDGASTWRRFRNITVPSIRPSIAIASTLMLVQGLRVFDQVMALTGGGPAGATETLATQVYKQTFALSNFGFGAALALVLTLVILVFSVLQQAATKDRS